MIIGVPKEIRSHEHRIGLVPASAVRLVRQGHSVLVEQGAGMGSGLSDEDYIQAGAELVSSPEDVYGRAEMIWKVGEPEPSEYHLLRKGQILFCYLHLAADKQKTLALMDTGVVAFAAEAVRLDDGSLPLLRPMSEVAGRLAIQTGACYLEHHNGGSGLLLGGVPGVKPGKVAILGGGTVGLNAARTAAGLGADVTVLDIDLDRLRWLDAFFRGRIRTLHSAPLEIEDTLLWADLMVGAVLVPAARTPILVSRSQLGLMRPGSVLVDISIDQGGCFESSHPTTREKPTYIVDGIVHFAVPNLPGSVARTSSFALNNATLHYGSIIAELGWKESVDRSPALARGLSILRGRLTSAPVAESLDLPFFPCSPS